MYQASSITTKAAIWLPPPLNGEGKPSDFSSMAEQMRTAYDNIAKLLARYDATHLRTSSKKRFMCWIWTLRLTSLVRFARLHMAVNARNAPVPS